MATLLSKIEVETRGHADVVDVTEMVRARISESRLQSGIACLFVPGATGGVTTVEYEPGCVADLRSAFERIAPAGGTYEHEKRWHDGNGHSHVRAALLGPSLAFPFADAAPLLGTWQQIVFVDFDVRSRRRELLLQLVGE